MSTVHSNPFILLRENIGIYCENHSKQTSGLSVRACLRVCARAWQNAYFLKFTASGTRGCHWTSDSQQPNTYVSVSVSTTAPTLTKILLAA